MPQLDLVSYMSGSFWIVLVLIVMYVILVKNVLPRIMYILKFRILKERKIKRELYLIKLSEDINMKIQNRLKFSIFRGFDKRI